MQHKVSCYSSVSLVEGFAGPGTTGFLCLNDVFEVVLATRLRRHGDVGEGGVVLKMGSKSVSKNSFLFYLFKICFQYF